MDYAESLAYVSGLQGRGWRLGLDRMLAFVRAAGLDDVLGEPGSPIQYLHVAGTNGKGSVTAYLQSMLVAQGYRTGGYFSPYVIDPRERIQVDGQLICKEEFAAVATELREVAERFDRTEIGGITEFEFKTAMGFLAWKRAGVEVVALEVGLGGRLDATNVVTSAVSVIVSISLDHTKILGETEAEIAREKAGILKPGGFAVVGPVSEEAEASIRAVAQEVGACPIYARGLKEGPGDQFDFLTDHTAKRVTVYAPGSTATLQPGIGGAVQYANAAVAYTALAISGFLRDPDTAIEAIANTRLVGRMQNIRIAGRELLVDGAHNDSSATVLVDTLVRTGKPKWNAIVGMLDGHDPRSFLELLGVMVDRVLAVRIDNPRSLDPEVIATTAQELDLEVQTYPSIAAALGALDDKPTVVTGSFYLVGEVMRLADSP